MSQIQQLDTPASGPRIRVLLADDHEIFRQSLRILLEQGGFTVVAEAANGLEAVRLAQTWHPDVAILDFGMPGMSGIEAAREIQAHTPQTRTILLAMHEDGANAAQALRAGMHGYLYKSQTADELVSTVAEIARGDIHFSSPVAQAPADTYETDTDTSGNILSNRERQILLMIAAGSTTSAIAQALGISRKTINSHRGSIMRKLHIHRAAGLTRYAIRQHLIAP